MLKSLDRALHLVPGWKRLRGARGFRGALGFEEVLWTRREADRAVRELVARLHPETLSALEISGEVWRSHGFAEYHSAQYPEFDLCRDVLPRQFDLVIAEHVFEHLLWPYRAGRNALEMVKPGGWFLMVTPFLYKVHHNPVDCTRWTETGIRYFLAECGFPLDGIVTGSWGNREVITATFRKEYRLFNRRAHSLRNEPDYPIVVWALARRAS